MSDIEPCLCIDEVQEIVSKSRPTIYRWIREARQGVGIFPLPINTGGRKRHLLWTRASIMEYLENRSRGSPQSSLNFMSEAEHRKRNDAARQTLKEMGVNLDDPEK